jgi:hypothetical protein
MNLHGLEIGVIMVAAVAVGHVLVIKWEYYWGTRTWPVMLAIGLGLLVCSIFADSMLLSGSLGILGITLVWGVRELQQQRKRVEQGLFPRNPRRRGEDATRGVPYGHES